MSDDALRRLRENPTHTPGPWMIFGKFGGHCALGHQSDSGQIRRAVEIQTHNTPEGDANIQLIKASPSLFAACVAAERFISTLQVPQDELQAALQIKDACKVLGTLATAINAALDRAEEQGL